jgi:hypothetical protein
VCIFISILPFNILLILNWLLYIIYFGLLFIRLLIPNFWPMFLINFHKKPKIVKKKWKPQKNAFWYICINFSIFNIITEEFKFSKVFWTRSTFNVLIFLIKGDRQMRFQVDQTTHRFWFWLKEIARWDLRLTQSKGQVAHENIPVWVCVGRSPLKIDHNEYVWAGRPWK